MNPVRRNRVAHVSSAHPWTDNRIHYRECVSLSELGYDVTLVAIASQVAGRDTDVRVIALSRLPRLRRVIFGSARAVARALRARAQVFHLHDPELAWAVPILRLLGKRVIYDAHEDLVMQVASKKYVKKSLLPVMTAAARVLLGFAKRSNHIIAATETIARTFPADKVSIVHNYPPLRVEEATAPPVSERPLSVVYVGGIGENRGARQMIDAMGEPSIPSGWRLEMAGTMPPTLHQQLADSPGWARVDFRGQVRPEEARDLLLRGRAGLVLFQDTRAHRDSLPTKMFEYFAAGVPVIASDFPLWRSIVEGYECGLLVDESSPSAIASAIATYADDPQLLDRHSRNARRVAEEKLNWASEVPTLASVYRRVLG